MKKTMDACKMDHFEKTITMTKKFYNAACVLNTPEYTELMNALKEHPDYEMKIRKIAGGFTAAAGFRAGGCE